MYITKVPLRQYPPPNIIHGVISAAFPERRNEKQNENLWRIDSIKNENVLLIVSKLEPLLSVLNNQLGQKAQSLNDKNDNANIAQTKDYEPYLAAIISGQHLRFRLCANPVRYEKREEKDVRGKPFACDTEDRQTEWLTKQSEKYGFVINASEVLKNTWTPIKTAGFRAVTFGGILTVTDTDKFQKALRCGIGKEKAYGCGLLTVIKEREAV